MSRWHSRPLTSTPSSPSRGPRGSPPATRPSGRPGSCGKPGVLDPDRPSATLPTRVQADHAIAIVVDVGDLATGLVQQVVAGGRAEVLPVGVARGGASSAATWARTRHGWDRRFRHYLHDDPAHTGTVWLRLRPDCLVAQDLSYSV